MYKLIVALLLFCFSFVSSIDAQTQKKNPYLKIQLSPIKIATQGQSIKLMASVRYKNIKEATGNLTFSLFNHNTQKSIDGWCINIFPFQYFTTIANQYFSVEFPFTVPADYEGSIDVLLKAEVENLHDTLRFTFPVIKSKTLE